MSLCSMCNGDAPLRVDTEKDDSGNEISFLVCVDVIACRKRRRALTEATARAVANKCQLCGADARLQQRGLDINFMVCVDAETCAERQRALARLAKSIGRKDDGVATGSPKPRFSLFPKGVLAATLRVLEFGAAKYGVDNWSKVDDARTRYYNAAQRHLEAWWSGEKIDAETGEPHLAHLLCCAMFLLGKDFEVGTPTPITLPDGRVVRLGDWQSAPARWNEADIEAAAKAWPPTMCGYRFKTGALCGVLQGHLGEAAHASAEACAAAHGEPQDPKTAWCKRCEKIRGALSCGCTCLGDGACNEGCGCQCSRNCWCWKIEGQDARAHYVWPESPPRWKGPVTEPPAPTPSPCAVPGCTIGVGPGATHCVIHTEARS